jgi:phosphatidylserine/phosphatidylglycerophosphate/cardiolipin synthase-like enzyme
MLKRQNLFILAIGLIFTFLSLSAQADMARFLPRNQDALQARVDLIQQAKSEIEVEYFSVWNDDQSLAGMDLLLQAAHRGVKVKVILDSMFTTIPRSLFGALENKSVGPDGQKNLEIRLYSTPTPILSKLFHRDHAKMLIVDNRIMITGGRNIGNKYFGLDRTKNYRDLDILLSGDVVHTARENFLEVWESHIVQTPSLFEYSPERLDDTACSQVQDERQCEIRREYAQNELTMENERLEAILRKLMTSTLDEIVHSETDTNWLDGATEVGKIDFHSHRPDKFVTEKTAYLSRDLLELLKNAKTSVEIVAPYFIPTENVLHTFRDLHARGIPVRVLTNSMRSNDNVLAQAGYRYMKQQIINTGIEVWESKGPDTIHAKTALIDGHKIIIGTYNLDRRSAFVNREVAVSFDSEVLAKQQQEIIDGFRENAYLVAKDGQEYNSDQQDVGVSKKKMTILKAVLLVTPLMIDEL